MTTADDVAYDEMYAEVLEDEARRAVWEAWAHQVAEAQGASSHNLFHLFWDVDGELVTSDIPALPPDAEKAAAEELLLCDGEPDVQGDEDGPEFVWKTNPFDALARVRPRLAASIRPSPVALRHLVPLTCRRTGTRVRAPRPVRRTRTASSRGDPDDPEPAGGRRLAEHSRRAA